MSNHYGGGGGGMHKRPYDSAPYQGSRGGYHGGGGGGADSSKRSRPDQQGHNSAGMYGECDKRERERAGTIMDPKTQKMKI